MRTVRSFFGLAGAVVPIVYCGGLLYYFADVQKWMGGALGKALGPTMLGLGAIGLLFLVVLLLRIRRLVGGPRAPKSGVGGRAVEGLPDEPSDFDPDAALARYLARRSAGSPGAASPGAPLGSGRPAGQAGFGRRGA